MPHNIDWLPNIARLENYIQDDETFDFVRLIKDRQNDLLNDFYNTTEPVLFNGSPVHLDNKILCCDRLEIKACHNDDYYTCEQCPFDNKLDIINHIFTTEYTNKKLKEKNGQLRVKKQFRKKGDSSIPRTPGEFCIPRALLSIWIKPIILHASDTENVVISPKNEKNTITIDLIHRKYRIHLKEIVSKNGFVYYVLKSAYCYTNPKELMELENDKYIQNALQKRRNATSGVSTTPCIDL
ncbi:MAG: hypothetical protein NC390_02345 [Fusobacterium sp.]|nr:hypothetical protein [Fusobacterium sp.]